MNDSEQKAIEPVISWRTREYPHEAKNSDWYWSVAVISIAVAVSSVFFSNVIFAILILIAGFALILHASRPPKKIDVLLFEEGIVIDKYFYPFSVLESFSLADYEWPTRVLLKSEKLFSPLIVIEINTDEVDELEVKKFLLEKIPEELDLHESIFQKIIEQIGF